MRIWLFLLVGAAAAVQPRRAGRRRRRLLLLQWRKTKALKIRGGALDHEHARLIGGIANGAYAVLLQATPDIWLQNDGIFVDWQTTNLARSQACALIGITYLLLVAQTKQGILEALFINMLAWAVHAIYKINLHPAALMPKIDLAVVLVLATSYVASTLGALDPEMAFALTCIPGVLYGVTLLIKPSVYLSLHKFRDDEDTKRLIRFLAGGILATTCAAFCALDDSLSVSVVALRTILFSYVIYASISLHRILTANTSQSKFDIIAAALVIAASLAATPHIF